MTAPFLRAAAPTLPPDTFHTALALTGALYTLRAFTPGAPDLTTLGALLNTWDMTAAATPQPNN